MSEPAQPHTDQIKRGPEYGRRLGAICPNRHNHTEGPVGYLEWHSWAEEMAATHEQTCCKACGMYVIWTPLAAADEEEAL